MNLASRYTVHREFTGMFYSHAGALAQDLLFLFLLVVAPLWDYRDTRRLKQNPSSAGKIRYYKTLCGWLWIASAVASVCVGFRPLFTINPTPDEAFWLLGHAWVRILVGAVVAIFMATTLLPTAVPIWKNLTKKPRRYASADALKSFGYFFPATWTERRWYVFICVTAGICEETLYRGFLLHYLPLHSLPFLSFRLNLTLALFISSAMFGLGHLYQGVGGAASTVVIGMLFGFLFLLTGSLLLPVVFHAAIDLRMLVILRPPADDETG
jgi:uncharacterized protein